jgi:tripartite-type tricarboxylate transporter receptor subunit TctC
VIISRRLILAAAATAAALPVRAQDYTRGRPLRWVVPFAAGGAADAIARIYADAYTSQTGQAIVIENRGGANGLLGVQAVTRSPPDGLTLGIFNVIFFTSLPQMLANPPYDPARDFTPITRLVTTTTLCVVTAARAKERGWRDFRSLINWAKQPGNRLTKGSAGNGSPGHLLIATVAKRTGADIQHIPYRGGAPALNDLLAGTIDMAFDFMPALMPLVASGHLVPLAVGSNARSPLMPEVPGLGEFADLNLGDVDLQSWNALAGPGNLPPEIVAAVHDGIRAAARAPNIADRLKAAGLILSISDSAEQVRADIERDKPRWREMVDISGARIE